MKRIAYTIPLIAALAISACDYLDPQTDNSRGEEILDEVAYFCGPLNGSYNDLPTLFDNSMDLMTDNAVRRALGGDYYHTSLGNLSPANNPLDTYEQCYRNIRNLNIFLSRMVLDESKEWLTPVRFFVFDSETDIKNNLNMFWRLKGEAHALRAYWQFELLRNFGGKAVNGDILGYPLVGDSVIDPKEDNMRIPRAQYKDCVQAIVDDCDSAAAHLPDRYGVPASMKTDPVYGSALRDHFCGAAAKALKARVLLYAASPANNPSGDISRWEAAAKAAGEAIKAAGGINAALSTRDEYYFTQLSNTDFANYDVLFRAKVQTGNSAFESSNYPAQLYGSALINVSQNFVDIFPDNKGYPISESTVYDPANPYANRDPRFDLFVGHDGSAYGSYKLDVREGGPESYMPLNLGSRSGYYLRKTLRIGTVNLDPANTKKTPRANIILGLPELLLNFAEAANKAWGPKGDPLGLGFNASDALTRILKRDNANGAEYLNKVIGSDAAKFDEYVKVQRRIELSFEGHYYYDLRRWYAGTDEWEEKINNDVYGVRISREGEYNYVLLETRYFKSPYQPISYSEVINGGLVQNWGW
ncbi:MAG: RagB/SusD family nutrient uptake outer membrane protein [Candidatus Cryptobacteroides sp.]